MSRFNEVKARIEKLKAHELAFGLLAISALLMLFVKVREGFDSPQKMAIGAQKKGQKVMAAIRG
jgi:hypothetical protein